MIIAEHIGKSYGNNRVLDDINFSVEEGEFITLIGASGCGKSTFLNLLLGTESPSSGHLLLDGNPIKEEPDIERGIVFQHYSVFPHMTVLENVIVAKAFKRKGIIGYLFGTARRAAKKEAMDILDQVGLVHALNHYPHELSGGMRQRLAIAQALIEKPRILLLDEPFGVLDQVTRADMHQLVLDLWQRYQLTVFMVTHDIKEGFYLGTRLWVFDKPQNNEKTDTKSAATITYDLPLGKMDRKLYEQIDADLRPLSFSQIITQLMSKDKTI